MKLTEYEIGLLVGYLHDAPDVIKNIFKKHPVPNVNSEDDILSKPFPDGLEDDGFYLSIRSKNAIGYIKNLSKQTYYSHLKEVNTIGDLIQYTERQLFSLPNVGRKTVFELKEALARKGLRFNSK